MEVYYKLGLIILLMTSFIIGTFMLTWNFMDIICRGETLENKRYFYIGFYLILSSCFLGTTWFCSII